MSVGGGWWCWWRRRGRDVNQLESLQLLLSGSLPYRVSIALIGADLYAGVHSTTQPSRLPPRGSREIIL